MPIIDIPKRFYSNCDFLGAGISVQAGIPDFRSSDGLFKSIKRDNRREALSSGKDLFDASVFNVSPKLHLSPFLRMGCHADCVRPQP